MTGKVGRNDPCPCGSGRKYKKCCQESFDEKDFHYRRWRRVEADLIPELLAYAFETLGPEAIEDAWREFHDYTAPGAYDPESPMNSVFMPWFLFNWIPETKLPDSTYFPEPIAASFHSEHALSEDEEKLIMSAIQTPYSFCEVVELTPGVGMTLFDLLRRVKYDVIERSASQTLKKGEIIYCATTHLDGISSNIGTSPYALRPLAKRDILEFRKWMTDESGGAELTADHLGEFEADIRSFYLDAVVAMFLPPQLMNTDNDPLLPQKVHFDVESADSAFHALKGLAEGMSEDELRSEATVADELIVKAEIPWLGGTKEARKRLGGPVWLGTINIEDRKLIIDVNSTKRAEKIRRLVEKRLGKEAVYKTTLIEPIESEVERVWAAAAGGPSELPAKEWTKENERTGVISLADLPPEVRLKLEENARQHWVTWFDVPVPALNNMTPRKAAKTEEGRELLESLLLDYERHDDDSNENLMRPDVPELRRKLGMHV
ncbi:MAG TPA: SEC-C metal-binding domain-containing protein [Pyrinomonadaceae bacterium]|nr:SEC-C metal-binding domain-containing protein [Pyrinomonadaceae bacterium]